MQAYKHTPGPLKAVQNAPDAFFLKDSEGQNVAEIYAVAEKHYPRIEANATLYALAPELVDALMTAYQNAVLTESEHARIRDVIRRIPGYKEPDRFAEYNKHNP